MDRILLLLQHRGNRGLLAELLSKNYQVVPADSERTLQDPFDLCIIDSLALTRLRDQVQARKKSEQPAFLPFLLITSRQDVGMEIRPVWQSVDELIVSPIEKAELRARVEVLLRARRLSQQNVALRRQLEAELARAAAVQAALLPNTYPVLPGFELAACCLPAREVGGDFYDWQESAPGFLTLTLGDVSGKGMPAALLMATIRATLRTVAQQNPPAAALELAQHALAIDFERSGSFVTLVHAQLDLVARRLIYVDAGHGHVFVRRRDGTAEELRSGGFPLGAFPEEGYEEGALNFQAGDALVLYSDGLIDAQRDLALTPTGLAKQLNSAAGAQAMVNQLAALPGLTGPLPDDLTVMVLCCQEET